MKLKGVHFGLRVNPEFSENISHGNCFALGSNRSKLLLIYFPHILLYWMDPENKIPNSVFFSTQLTFFKISIL